MFPDGRLFGGDQNTAINQLGSGALDGLILASSAYASFEPRMNAISLPYLFEDYDQLQAYLGGEPGEELKASLARLDIHGLGFFLRTFRNVTTRETPITTAEDFSGLTMRTPNNTLFVALFEALGANPTPMACSEVYSALQLRAQKMQANEFVEGELARVQEIARGIYPRFEEQIGAEFMTKSLEFVQQ